MAHTKKPFRKQTFTTDSGFTYSTFRVWNDKELEKLKRGGTFLAIPNYNGNYHVSNNGVVVSTKCGRFTPLTNCDNGNGYLVVVLTDSNGMLHKEYVHRLVAVTYIPNPHNKPQVNHLDGDRTNNSVSNLEWTTVEENQKHRHWLHLMKKACGSNYMKAQELENISA